jgi:hypothetical protein
VHHEIFRRLHWLVLFVLAAIVAGTPLAASAGCSKDTDCKGDRVCEDGTCVSPDSGGDYEDEADEDWDSGGGGGGGGMGSGPATMCVTPMGPCPMMVPMPKGQGCTCMMPMGPVPGTSR